MARRERDLDPESGPIAAFAAELRELRRRAGTPTYQQLARASERSRSALADAAGGLHLPRWETVEGYVRACGGERELALWRARWELAKEQDADAVPLPEPGQGALPEVWNLPPRSRDFVGRGTQLAQIGARLHARSEVDGPVTVALWGVGGIGKSQLALEYAYRYARHLNAVWWIDGTDGYTLREGLLDLARHIGLGDERPRNALVRLQAALRARDDWLLIVDDVGEPATYLEHAPSGPGRVLLTGRTPELHRLGGGLEIGEFARSESLDLLHRRVPDLADAGARRVAEALDDYPLALEQAGSFLDGTGMAVATYLELVTRRPREAGLERRTLHRHSGLAEVVDTSRARLQGSGATSGELADRLAFFSPEPLPVATAGLEDDAGSEGPAPEAPDAWGVRLSPAADTPDAVHRLLRLALVRRDDADLSMHALVQALLRDRLSDQDRDAVWAEAGELLATARPGPVDDPSSWPRYGRLAPHVRALLAGPAGRLPRDSFRAFLARFTRYLFLSGRYDVGAELSRVLFESWSDPAALGPDHPDTLLVGNRLVGMYFGQGRYEEAAELGAKVLERRRRVSGADHEETLSVANNLAAVLSELGLYEKARGICLEAFEARRRTMGDDHPLTLAAASNYAAVLESLGRYQEARQICEDIWNRRRRLLGADHPDTLWTAHILADVLAGAGRSADAVLRYQDVLARRRRVLGPDHPDSLDVAHDLGALLADLRDGAARGLLEETLRRRRQVLGEDHPETQDTEAALRRSLGTD